MSPRSREACPVEPEAGDKWRYGTEVPVRERKGGRRLGGVWDPAVEREKRLELLFFRLL